MAHQQQNTRLTIRALFKHFASRWNDLLAPKGWYLFGDPKSGAYHAKRWNNGHWEIREATPAEAEEAQMWQANR